jgi:hypothetical protein
VRLGTASVIFAVCLSCLGLNTQGSKKARTSRNPNGGITVQVSASHTEVRLRPPPDQLPLNCEPMEEVRLLANTTSPRNSPVKLSWQVPVGRVSGNNREVTWNLSGVKPGTYTATVEASDRYKNAGSGSITVTVVVCPAWRPDPPPCPNLSVSCPSTLDSNGSATFEATVAGGDPTTTLTYKWSLTAGRIISGQGTPKLTVDASGLSRESITATMSLSGMNPACLAVASCTIVAGTPQ